MAHRLESLGGTLDNCLWFLLQEEFFANLGIASLWSFCVPLQTHSFPNEGVEPSVLMGSSEVESSLKRNVHVWLTKRWQSCSSTESFIIVSTLTPFFHDHIINILFRYICCMLVHPKNRKNPQAQVLVALGSYMTWFTLQRARARWWHWWPLWRLNPRHQHAMWHILLVEYIYKS